MWNIPMLWNPSPNLSLAHWWKTVARLVWSKHGLVCSWVSIYILLGGPSPPPPVLSSPPSILLCLFTLSEYFHSMQHERHLNRWWRRSIGTFKCVFIRGVATKKRAGASHGKRDIWGSQCEVWDGRHHRANVRILWDLRVPKRERGSIWRAWGTQLPQAPPVATSLFLYSGGWGKFPLTKYNRVPIHSTLYEANPNFGVFLSRKLLFRYSPFLSFIKSTKGQPMAKGLASIPVLWRPWKQGCGAGKVLGGSSFGSGSNVPVSPGKMYRAPDITNVTALIRISLSIHFTLTSVVKFIPLSELEIPYLWQCSCSE